MMQTETQWRTPTDEDAKRRPKCRVRDNGGHWQQATLYGVYHERGLYFGIDSEGQLGLWDYCEIEDKPEPKGYLCLSRKDNETLLIGDSIEVMVGKILGNRVILNIRAPQNVRVVRSEIVNR